MALAANIEPALIGYFARCMSILGTRAPGESKHNEESCSLGVGWLGLSHTNTAVVDWVCFHSERPIVKSKSHRAIRVRGPLVGAAKYYSC